MGMNQYADIALPQYISQYVPTNVQFLYNVAKDQVDQQSKVRKEVQDQLKEWAKFHSLSDIDNQNYYDLTLNPMQELIRQGSANPELMKSSAFRNQLLNQINNIDYAKISQLETNAKNFDTRAKVIADMKSKGMYADWMDDPTMTPEGMTQWDTLKSGIMSDLSPIMFKDLRTIGDPYVEGLKPRFYAKIDPNSGAKKQFTDWSSITMGDIQREFNAHLTDITSTPQGQAWYNRIADQMKRHNPNVSQDQIDQQFVNMLAAQQTKRIVSTPIVDQVGLAMWKQNALLEAKKIAAGNKAGTNPALGFTNISSGNASEYLKNKAAAALSRRPEIVQRSQKGLQIAYDSLVTEYDRIVKADPNSNFAKQYASLKQKIYSNKDIISNRDTAVQMIAQGALALQQQMRANGQNITNDVKQQSYLQQKIDHLAKRYSENNDLGLNTLLQDAAETTASQLHYDIGDGYTTGESTGKSSNAFTQFDFSFDAGQPIVKDNATKQIIDHTYHTLFTPLQGKTNDLVTRQVAVGLVGKPLDINQALTPAQVLQTNPFFADYWANAMKINAERQYRNYKGGDKATKIASAENVAMTDVIYDRQKSPWYGVGRTNSWRNDMNLEKHTINGKIPSPTVTAINGYSDTSDGSRLYDVTVELPLEVLTDDHEHGFDMSWHYDGDAVEKALTGFGYKVRVGFNEGKDKNETHKYIQWHMAVPFTNDDLQQYYSDQSVAKDQQTTTNRKAINNTDDALLALDGYDPTLGWD